MKRLAAVAVALCLTLTACSKPPPDTEAQEKVLSQYVAAVQSGDRDRIAELVPPSVNATTEIEKKINTVGNRTWRDVRVTWRRGDFPMVAAADIVATDAKGAAVRDTVQLSKVEDSWYLNLGSVADGSRSPPPC